MLTPEARDRLNLRSGDQFGTRIVREHGSFAVYIASGGSGAPVGRFHTLKDAKIAAEADLRVRNAGFFRALLHGAGLWKINPAKKRARITRTSAAQRFDLEYEKPRLRPGRMKTAPGDWPFSYRWFVVSKAGEILGGNEYKDDAKDAAAEIRDEVRRGFWRGKGPQSTVRVASRASLVKSKKLKHNPATYDTAGKPKKRLRWEKGDRHSGWVASASSNKWGGFYYVLKSVDRFDVYWQNTDGTRDQRVGKAATLADVKKLASAFEARTR